MKTGSSLVCLFLLGTAAAAADWNAEGKRWWSHVQYLADDKLEGRETGRFGEDLTVGLRTNPPPTLEAPTVFVGYGLSIPEAHYDDFAGLDLRGKIAVHLAGGPSSIPGPLRAHYSSTSERWKAPRRLERLCRNSRRKGRHWLLP